MASPFGPGKRKGLEPHEERELTPEERLLAEKARAAAAKREAERRQQTLDVSDFLDGILDASRPEPAEPSGPDVEMVLSAEPEEPGVAGTKVEPPTPFASGDSEPVVSLPFEPEEPTDHSSVSSETGLNDPRSLTSLMGRRTLSAPLAEAWAEVMSFGRSGEDVLHPEFEPEAAGTFDRMMAGLGLRRRRRPRLAFEPDEAAGGPIMQPTDPTMLLRAPEQRDIAGAEGALELPPSGGPDGRSSGPLLPSDPTIMLTEMKERRPPEEAGEQTAYGAAAAEEEAPPTSEASEPAAAPSYSLDDLPALLGGPGPERGEQAEKLADMEPAMEEEGLDDTGLREALAAAEAASRKAISPRPAAATSPADWAEPTPVSPPSPARRPSEKRYSMDDLPQAPIGSGRAEESDGSDGADRSDGPGDDHLGEEGLPELPAAGTPLAAHPPLGVNSLDALERATDRSVTTGSSGVQAAPAMAASGADSPPPASEPAAAENAADLSIRQLADMERYIESQMDAGADLPVKDAPSRAKRRRSMSRIVAAAALALRKVVSRAIGRMDRMLAPYSLSCKRLVGIVGLVIWAVVIALVVKIWVLSGTRGGE